MVCPTTRGSPSKRRSRRRSIRMFTPAPWRVVIATQKKKITIKYKKTPKSCRGARLLRALRDACHEPVALRQFANATGRYGGFALIVARRPGLPISTADPGPSLSMRRCSHPFVPFSSRAPASLEDSRRRASRAVRLCWSRPSSLLPRTAGRCPWPLRSNGEKEIAPRFTCMDADLRHRLYSQRSGSADGSSTLPGGVLRAARAGLHIDAFKGALGKLRRRESARAQGKGRIEGFFKPRDAWPTSRARPFCIGSSGRGATRWPKASCTARSPSSTRNRARARVVAH